MGSLTGVFSNRSAWVTLVTATRRYAIKVISDSQLVRADWAVPLSAFNNSRLSGSFESAPFVSKIGGPYVGRGFKR